MQTVKKLKKWVLSSFNNLTDSQHKLVTTSRGIEGEWQRKEYVEDTSVVDAWCKAFREELLFQLDASEAVGNDNGSGSGSERKSLPESAMTTTLDAAHVLSRTAGPESERCFAENEIVPLLTRYLIQSGCTMPRKVRDGCCSVLATIASSHPAMLMELLRGVLPVLHVAGKPQTPSTAETPHATEGSDEVPRESTSDSSTACLPNTATTAAPRKTLVTAQQVHLASLLVTTLNKSVAVTNPDPPRYLDDPTVLCLVEDLIASTCHLVNGGGLSSTASVTPASSAVTQPSTPATSSLSRVASPVSGTTSVFNSHAVTGNDGVSREDTTPLAVVVYTALIGCLCRGQDEHKLRVLCTHSHVLTRCWHSAVQRLSRLPRTLTIGASRESVVALEPASFWQSALVEMALELATEGCFTLCRLRVAAEPSPRLASAGEPVDAPTSAGSASRHGHVQEVRFEPMPAHWDTLLTGGGSTHVWRLAALLPTCPVVDAGVPFLQGCLIGLDTTNPHAETVYRSLMCSMMLFCAGNPCTASAFAHHGLFDVLIALLTYQQQSVFPPQVSMVTYTDTSITDTASNSRSISKDERGVETHPNDAVDTNLPPGTATLTTQVISPVAQLSSNTAQLTSSFISSLAVLAFPTKLLLALMKCVEAMRSHPTCQTDVDLIESLLHVLATAYMPTHLIFFPGSGSVVCNAHRFVGSWSGYSFAAWLNPICVWPQGNLLFSVKDHSGGTTELLVVANGRSCCLALRLSNRSSGGGDPSPLSTNAFGNSGTSAPLSPPSASSGGTFLMIPGSVFPAEAWSHIAFTHDLVAPHAYVNGKRFDIPVNLPFPKEASRRHRLQVALGGIVGANSFVGFVARMDVLDGGLSDSDVAKLYEAGPAKAAASTDYHTLLSLRCHTAGATEPVSLQRRASDTAAAPTAFAPASAQVSQDGTGTGPHHRDPRAEEDPSFDSGDGADALFAQPGSPVCLSGSLVGKREGISMHGIIPYVTADMKATFADCDVVAWALRTLEESRHHERFLTIARLCIGFITTPMRMAQSMSEREECLKGGAPLEQLCAQILTWPDTYVDLANALLTSVTIPGTTSRVLAPHSSTQTVVTTLLDRLRVVSGELTQGACPADRLIHNSTTANSILRELSDALLVRENVDLFLAVPRRFTQVLSLSVHLPPECTESVVMLIEKLCKAANELEATLRFLLATHTQPTAGQAKAEIVRMLFDVSRANPSMCDMVGGCFKGTGLHFLLELIHGRNHHSEAIRVYTLRLLSLTLYTSKKLRVSFLKNEGFALLRLAITDPSSLVPVRLPTLDCLFHMAFQGFRPTESVNAALATHPKGSGHSRSPSKISTGAGDGGGSSGGVSSVHRSSVARAASSGLAALSTMPGHLPGLISRRLRVTHREFSFEVKRDFAARGADDRWQSDDSYRGRGIEGSLTLPQALEAALGVIGYLIAQSASGAAHALPTRDAPGGEMTTGPASFAPARLQVIGRPHESTATVDASTAAALASSAESTVSEEDRAEDVVLPGLAYLEKIVDVAANAEALVHTSWLRWLWQAVSSVVAHSRASTSAGLAIHVPVPVTTTTASATFTPEESEGVRTRNISTSLADEAADPMTPLTSPVPAHVPPFSGSHPLASPTTPSSSAPRYARRFTNEVLARTRGIIRRVVTLEMRLNGKSPTVRRLRSTIMAPALVRIVLEETARYYSRAGHSDLADPDSAANVIKNLDALLQDVEELLLPFPAALGIELVTFISTIAVNSNSWVRMRMKNSSSLFQTRDHFAFFLLSTMRKLTKVRPPQLIQLLDACTCHPGALVVLVRRLQAALDAKDVNELERALLLIRHLTVSDVEQSHQLAVLLGERGTTLAELLTMNLGEGNPFCSPSDEDTHLGELGRSSSVLSSSTAPADSTALPVLPTAQIVEWRQSHPDDYAAVVARVSSEAADVDLTVRSQGERIAKNRAALVKPTRVAEQRRQQVEAKLCQEFQQLTQAVQAERARKRP